MRKRTLGQGWWVLCVGLLLTGCDQLGLETPAKAAERQVAEAKAIGGACRHALRAIEDCYVLNAKADKSSVFAGWREMDEYMRENKLEGIEPVVPRPSPAASKARPKSAEEDEAEEEEVVVSETASPSSAPSEAKGESRAARGVSDAGEKPAKGNPPGRSDRARSAGASAAEKPASESRP